jgi:hypothetical protein
VNAEIENREDDNSCKQRSHPPPHLI